MLYLDYFMLLLCYCTNFRNRATVTNKTIIVCFFLLLMLRKFFGYQKDDKMCLFLQTHTTVT